MKLNVFELMVKKVQTLHYEFEESSKILKRDDFEIVLKSPLRVIGDVYYDGEIINVEGNISVTIEAQCSRCLCMFNYELDINFNEEYSKVVGDEEMYPIEDSSIDLTDVVIDNILLSLPYRVLCSTECAGLCPHCGRDLNKGICNCQGNEIDPRLETLKDLFKED